MMSVRADVMVGMVEAAWPAGRAGMSWITTALTDLQRDCCRHTHLLAEMWSTIISEAQ